MPVCRISGLIVDSETELPGVLPLPDDAPIADVRIRQRRVPERLEAATDSGPNWELERNRLLLHVPSLGSILAANGETIDVAPAPGVAVREIFPFVLGTGWGAILNQRGMMTLHASVVSFRGRAIAICAPSGYGKSTLAAALCRAGADFVCDDIAAVEVDSSGRPVVWPDGRCLKLFDDSITRLEFEGARIMEVRQGIGKHYVRPPGDRAHHSVPLDAVYTLRRNSPGAAPVIKRLSSLDAAQRLLGNSYRRRLVLGIANQGHMFGTAAILTHKAVFEFDNPDDLGRIEESSAALMGHWNGLDA